MTFALRLCTLALFTLSVAQARPQAEKPIASPHRIGPNGWEGWTLNASLGRFSDGSPIDSSKELYPYTLVLSHHGHIIRRISGEPFVWHWIFWGDGKQVAYETGPLHFSLECTLADSLSGRVLESLDCYQGIPDNAPAWLEALEAAR